MAPKKVNKPLGMLVVEKVGLRRGLRALTYIVAWGLASDAEGHPLTVEEYTAHWKQSLSTSYREREAFLMVWPDLKDPGPVWDRVRDAVTAKRPELALTEIMGVRL
jgi:hypothetical protein